MDRRTFMAAAVSLPLLNAAADASAVLESASASRDFDLSANPASADWNKAPHVTADRDYLDQPIAGPPTEIRSRWTKQNLYLLYTCPYDELNLKPDPDPTKETPQLWNW